MSQIKGLAETFRKLDSLEKVYRKWPRKAGAIAVRFFKERFRTKDWVDQRTEPWPKRSFKGAGGSLMVGKQSGALRRSIRVVRSSQTEVVIGTDMKYAQIHNEGGKVPITAKSRKFFWAKHLEAKEQNNVRMARYWLGLATTKKQFFKIPKRQFLGPSQVLANRIERHALAEVSRALKA